MISDAILSSLPKPGLCMGADDIEGTVYYIDAVHIDWATDDILMEVIEMDTVSGEEYDSFDFDIEVWFEFADIFYDPREKLSGATQ